MRHFGGGLRSEALKRAYLLGHRIKATCSICGKPIYNRMVTRANGIYAHTLCSKTQTKFKWVECW
jgi:hypothetical protein